jgi:hypothetical protein
MSGVTSQLSTLPTEARAEVVRGDVRIGGAGLAIEDTGVALEPGVTARAAACAEVAGEPAGRTERVDVVKVFTEQQRGIRRRAARHQHCD